MKWTFPLKPQYQATRLRHFGCVIFDGLTDFYGTQNPLNGNIPLKHTLNGVDTEEEHEVVQ